MNDEAANPATDAQRAQRANRLGLLLGGACLALTALFFIIFMVNGFPKDPAEYLKLMNRRQALIDQGGADGQPAPARPGEGRAVDQKPADQEPAGQRPADQRPADQQ